MKKALITGITGQDGSYLAELLLTKGYEVYGLVRMSSDDNMQRLKDIISNKNLHILYGDMTDESSIYNAIKTSLPDEIYNLAAQSHVGLSKNFTEYTTNINAMGLLRIINVVTFLGIDKKVKIYQATTSEIFGNAKTDLLNEETELNPSNAYACAKCYAYLLAKCYRKQGMFIVNGIAFPHESRKRSDKFVTRKITKAAVKIKLGKQDKLSLGNISVRRDWGHAGDYVKAMWLAMQHENADDYIIATGITTSLKELCIKAFNMLNIELEFKGEGLEEKAYDKKTGKLVLDIDKNFHRPNEHKNPTGDISKIKRILGWEPKMTIDDIVKEMIEEDLKLEN
ncbi:GDP-mannose 4,6-dehydratase [bacterium]|nr:GDP-mannose 4,6-dehydratase [bacterium]